jgi:hypothetical protein
MARPTGLEPVTFGSGGRFHRPARDGPRRLPLIFRPVLRVGGNCFPPQTATDCHTAVTPQPFELRSEYASLDLWLVRTPHANTCWFHDPESVFYPFGGQDRKHPGQQVEHMPPTGIWGSKHHDADVVVRRIRPDVREIEVEREEHARLRSAYCSDFEVVRAGKPLVVDSVAIPAGRTQARGSLQRQILIDLRAHARALRREGQNPLLRQIGGIRQGRLNVSCSERWVASNDVVGGEPVSQIGEDDRHWNPRATNARLAVKNSLVDRDVFAPVHGVPIEGYPEAGPLSNAGQEEHACSL